MYTARSINRLNAKGNLTQVSNYLDLSIIEQKLEISWKLSFCHDSPPMICFQVVLSRKYAFIGTGLKMTIS